MAGFDLINCVKSRPPNFGFKAILPVAYISINQLVDYLSVNIVLLHDFLKDSPLVI